MDENIITKICGMIPDGFVKVTPQDSNYIFQNDLSFSPINLYDFFGRAATVNSFAECFYYVELGFEPNKTTIFDYGLWTGTALLLCLLLFKVYKEHFVQRLIRYLKTKKISRNFLNIPEYKRTKIFVGTALLFQSIIFYDYIKTKSLRLPRFIDEYITLTSHVNFFRSFDFDAGLWLGGNYSVDITTGPIAAIGSVIGWNLTNSLAFARVSNFVWIFIMQTIFVYLLTKAYKIEKTSFLNLSTAFVLILIPWWQGSLYSIGEIPSTLVFINAIFLFAKFRKLSIVLFCLSIVYGKFLMLVPFVGFYIVILYRERNLQNLINDTLVFLLSMVPWLTLAHFKYEKGNLIDYLNDQFYFITNHQTSGVQNNSGGFFENLILTLNSSEFTTWSTYEKGRILVIPLIFIVIILRNKENIDNYFGNITVPITFATTFIYLWFWILNSTKWIRHTQHFTIIVLVSIVYLLGIELIDKKIDIFVLLSLITFFIDNNKNLIYFAILIYFVMLFVTKKNTINNQIKYILLVILFLDITLVYFENTSSGNINEIFEECRVELKNDLCRNAYLSG
ncbi:MAG: hypothetical protein CBE33_05370 [Candidatus Pelagibacter sp. TMED273]|nr:MAG: hypothetical protein CBE33_05370 [Candidatus Pelagibacter sp. TMED273]|tara:strand:+ start:13235 stop:14923 length:1689 start_codon:yes stop_codon:yes gene_type:complete